MSDIFRNKLRKYDKVSDIVAGLVNYRIMNQMLIETNIKIIRDSLDCF